MVIMKYDGHELEILPERGAILSRWTYEGKKIFFEDENLQEAPIIRGGMPILFPLCGRLQDDLFHYNQKQYQLNRHGFARDCKWSIMNIQHNLIELKLREIPKTFDMYPFQFEFIVQYAIQGNKLNVSSIVKNTGNINMPYQIGFHPYFWTENKMDSKLHFDWQEEVTHIAKLENSFVLQTPDFRMTLTRIKGFDHVVLWSLPEKRFICVEPWLGSVGSLQSAEYLFIAPERERQHVFTMEIELM